MSGALTAQTAPIAMTKAAPGSATTATTDAPRPPAAPSAIPRRGRRFAPESRDPRAPSSESSRSSPPLELQSDDPSDETLSVARDLSRGSSGAPRLVPKTAAVASHSPIMARML